MATVVDHLVLLRSVTLDHVRVLLGVAATVICLLRHLRCRVAVPVSRRLLCPCHSLTVFYVGLRRDGSRSTAASAHSAREHLHLLETSASSAHGVHLLEHARAATEATSEEVVIVVEHSEAAERIAPVPPASSATHPAKIVVEEVLKRVFAAEESSEDVVSLRECEMSSATSAAAKSLEES